MKPVDISTSAPRSIDELAVEWDRVVHRVTPVDPAQPYLALTARLTGSVPFARRFELRADGELDRLLDYVHTLSFLQPDVIPRLLGSQEAAAALTAFHRDPGALEHALRHASFTYASPFLLEGYLAEYLYWSGVARPFYQQHPARHAVELARGLLVALGATDLDGIVPFQARLGWGGWFQPQSTHDATFAIVHRGTRVLTLCCFTHNDGLRPAAT
jgi:hypothetical protein